MRLLSLVAATLFLSSCATIMSGTSQEVHVASDPASSFEVAPLGESGETPRGVILPRGESGLVVRFHADGCPDAEVHLRRHLNPWIFGNLLFGGVLGLVIDFVNGAAWTYDPEVRANLHPSPAPAGDRSAWRERER